MNKNHLLVIFFIAIITHLNAQPLRWNVPAGPENVAIESGNISNPVGTFSLPTDYFRSVTSGSWSNTATWQSSTNNITWTAATLVPGVLAAHVFIRSPDSVYLAANASALNVTVSSGAVLNAQGFTLTVALSFNLLGTASFYQGGNVVDVPGVLPVLDPASNYHFNGTQTPGAVTLPAFGNLIWETTPTASGTFQNLTAPFPFNNGLVVLGDMTINLKAPFEVRFNSGTLTARTHTINGNLNIISANSTVVVQGGSNPASSTLSIGGDLNITAGIFSGLSPGGASGNAVVTMAGNINNTGGTIQAGSGSGAYYFNFVGPGIINVDAGTGNSFHNVTIGTGKIVTLTNNNFNIISGKDLALSGHIILGNNDLTIDGTISNASATAHVVTNGTGLLTIKKIFNAATIAFPVGASAGTYDPLTITNNDAAAIDFSAKVDMGITPTIPVPAKAVNRIWTIKPSATPSSVNVLFEYAIGDCNAAFNYSGNLELGQYIPSAWNVVKTGIVPSGSYQANVTNITSFAGATASPFVLGNLFSILAFDGVGINYFTGIRQNGTHKLNWEISCNGTPSVTINLERSADTRDFVSINSISATSVRCDQPFNYTDAQPSADINYYRLKIVDADGKITYSNTIALINATKGFALMNIAPNPVRGNSFKLNATSASANKMELVISDMQGRVVNRQTISLTAGFNSTDINVGGLAPGTYNIYGLTGDYKSGLIRFVKQ